MNKDDDRKLRGASGLKNIQVEAIFISDELTIHCSYLRALRGEVKCIANSPPAGGLLRRHPAQLPDRWSRKGQGLERFHPPLQHATHLTVLGVYDRLARHRR